MISRFVFLVVASLISAVDPAWALDPASAFTDYTVTTWTHKDGLVSTFILAITQSADGYVWVGTTDGLFRFDGVRFVQWRTPDRQHRGLGVVSALCATRDGSLWAGTESGSVARIRGQHVSTSSAGAPVQGILEDRDGSILVATGDRLLQYRSNQPSPADEVSLRSRLLSGPMEDPSGSIWLSTESGVQRLDPPLEQRRLTQVLGGRIWLSQDASGAIWATRDGGLSEPVVSLARKGRGSDSHVAQKGLDIRAVLHDSRGTTWIATFGAGLFRVGADGGHADRWTQSAGLADESVSTLFEDREHNLWVGTRDGLQCLRDKRIRSLTRRDGLASSEIAGLASSGDGSLWVATPIGINRIDHGPNSLYLKDARVTALTSDERNRIWAATATGIVRLTNGKAEPIRFPSGIELTHVTAISIDKSDDVWLCDSRRGLFRWSNGRIDDFSHEPLLEGKAVRSAAVDSRGRMWFGLSEGGVVIYGDGHFHEYLTTDGLTPGSVNSLAPDANGAMWIGAEDGLSRFDGARFTTWTAADGLPGSRVLWVLTDRSGPVWLGFSFGIVRIERSALEAAARSRSGHIEFDLFDSGDGLDGNPNRVSQPAVVEDRHGAIWFQTSQGISIIDPRRLAKNPIKPPVHIESMTADRIPLDVAQPIRLQPGTRDIEFEYTAPSFVEPRRVRFRYMLEGYDSAWQEAGTRRQAFYTNLSPRRYRFRVLASNNDGVWNEQGAALQFQLLPAFYQTSLFRFLSVLVLAMFCVGIYRWRVWQVTARLRARFDERLAERARIAQELHDNLLQNVLGISLQLEVTDELLPAGSVARKPLEEALRLSKASMTEGRRALNDLRSQALGSDDLVKAFAQVARDFPARAVPEMDILTEGEERPLNAAAGQDVLQIGRQAIANAIQHAHAARVHVLLSYSRRGLSVRVKDNGHGIDQKTLNLGRAGHHGIAGMRERAERIGATLSILSRSGEGTEVCLDVPDHLIFQNANSKGSAA